MPGRRAATAPRGLRGGLAGARPANGGRRGCAGPLLTWCAGASRMAGADRAKRTTKPVEKYMPPEVPVKPKAKKVAKAKPSKPANKAKAEKKTGEKKPLSGYMLFCKHNREEAKKKVPSGLESNMPAVAKILGQMWAKESDASKETWKAGKVPK